MLRNPSKAKMHGIKINHLIVADFKPLTAQQLNFPVPAQGVIAHLAIALDHAMAGDNNRIGIGGHGIADRLIGFAVQGMGNITIGDNFTSRDAL